MSKAEKRFQTFHGYPSRRVSKRRVPKTPPFLVEIGPLEELTYSSPKDQGHNEPPTGGIVRRSFSHDFEKPPLLATDPEGKNLFIIGKTKVTNRGIEG